MRLWATEAYYRPRGRSFYPTTRPKSTSKRSVFYTHKSTSECHGTTWVLEREARSRRVIRDQSSCAHSGCDMTSRAAVSTSITCQCHDSRFDLHGNILRGPANSPLTQFAVDLASDATITGHRGPWLPNQNTIAGLVTASNSPTRKSTGRCISKSARG